MKKILSFLLLLFTLLHSNNDDFSLIIKQPFDAALFDITEDYDRKLSAVGFSKGSLHKPSQEETYTNAFDYLASLSGKHGSQMHLVKVGDSAEIILSKVAKLSEFNEAIALVKTPQNGYIAGGHTLGGEVLIVKLDANANTIYTKKFAKPNFTKIKDLILLGDGGVLAVGTSATDHSSSYNIFENGLGNNDIYLARFSKDGEKLWTKKYGTGGDDEGFSAVEARDGSLMVVGRTTHQSGTQETTLLRLTDKGDKIWMQHKSNQINTLPTKMIQLKENNFLVSFIEYNAAQKEHIRLLKFDIFGKTVADKEIFTKYPSGLHDIKEFANGTLIGVGYVRDEHNQDGLAMQLASNLTLLNQEHYGNQSYDSFYAAHILHNSQVGVAGLHTDKSSQESNMWIVKLNANGTMAKRAGNINQNTNHNNNNTNSDTLFEKLQKLFAKEIANNQLRIDRYLQIEFLDPTLYFEVGSYRLSQRQQNFLRGFSDKLIPFLQEHSNAIETLSINGHTSSEWGKTDFTQTYLKNAKLSMERSFATMSYIFKTRSHERQKFLSKILRGSGHSYSRKVVVADVEDKEKSRRVNFRIILK